MGCGSSKVTPDTKIETKNENQEKYLNNEVKSKKEGFPNTISEQHQENERKVEDASSCSKVTTVVDTKTETKNDNKEKPLSDEVKIKADDFPSTSTGCPQGNKGKVEDSTKREILPLELPQLPFTVVNMFDVVNGATPIPDQPPISDKLEVKVGKLVYVPEELEEPLLRIEDTFWKEKKRVMPDIKAMKHIEEHALKAPVSVMSTPESLATYLVEPCKTDIEKVRAIYWWITHNIKYVKGCHGNTAQEVLQSKSAVCAGYAHICCDMMKSVGLEVAKVSGISKGAGYWPGIDSLDDRSHAWNKVKIDGAWFLLDATWSAGGQDSSSTQRMFAFKWDETYFMTDPQGFIFNHLPLGGSFDYDHGTSKFATVLTDEQLLSEPVTVAESWDQEPYMTPICHFLGIKPVNHLQGVIHTANNLVSIKLSSCVPTYMQVSLETKMYSSPLQQRTWIANNGKDIEICARLMGTGIYNLTIKGHPWRLEKLPENHNEVWVSIKYTIAAKGDENQPRFPKNTKHLGPTLRFIDSGFKIIHPPYHVIEAVDGYASVVMEMPDAENVTPFWAKLYKTNTDMNSRHLLVEKQGKYSVVHVSGLARGEYLLDLILPSKGNTGSSGASFLIVVKKKTLATGYLFPESCHKLMGSQVPFVQNDISVLYPENSTIFAKDGKAMVITTVKTAVETFVAFNDINENRYDEYVSEETKDNLKYYKIDIEEPGIYLLTICIKPEGYPGVRFLVVYPQDVSS